MKKKIKRIHQHLEQLSQKTNWKMQKDSQTYSQIEIHREQDMKGKGWFNSLCVPMGEGSEYIGVYPVGDIPWVWVVRAIYWTHKSWGLTKGREKPLNGCRAMWTNRRSLGSPDSPLQENAISGLHPSTMKMTDWDCICWCLFSQQLPSLAHALLTPCGRSALEKMLPWPGRQLGCGKWRCIWVMVACGWRSRGHAHGGHLHRQHIRKSADLWWRPECHSRWPSVCPEPMRFSSAQ